ncbi:MAG: hypothetical protein O3A79_03365 [Candidatus Marinimicrobia bacterium]|nr:hypothetical protein [Candidatus Neomarinimicrobiota bacterium]
MNKKENWKDAPMPDSSPGTKILTYFVNDNERRSRLMLVNFPSGFERKILGHYPSYEELFILEGSLEISGYKFVKNDYVLFPPNFSRYDTACKNGCLAIVWWSDKPDWSQGKNPNSDENIFFKTDINYENKKNIELLNNQNFHSIYLKIDENNQVEEKVNYIGVDLLSYEFVTGENLSELKNSTYFLKLSYF